MASWRDAWVPIWLCRQDLVDATSTDIVIACCDDTGDGEPESRGVKSLIARAEGKVLSYLVVQIGPPPLSEAIIAQLRKDPLLGGVALEFAIAFMFDKHPEYVRSNRKDDVDKRLNRAEAEMKRILDARQQPPTVAKRPANVGGVSVDNGPRAYVDSADGTRNNGDY
jgi:hypothetical protein